MISREVLKGHIDTIILSLLSEQDRYGYEITKLVREKSQGSFEMKEGTLYLSLKRLEKDGYVESYWSEEQGPGGRRKYYRISDSGRNFYQKKLVEWKEIKDLLNLFLEGSI